MRTAFRREIVDTCESPWLHVRNVGACEGRGSVWRSDSGAIVTQGDMVLHKNTFLRPHQQFLISEIELI